MFWFGNDLILINNKNTFDKDNKTWGIKNKIKMWPSNDKMVKIISSVSKKDAQTLGVLGWT